MSAPSPPNHCPQTATPIHILTNARLRLISSHTYLPTPSAPHPVPLANHFKGRCYLPQQKTTEANHGGWGGPRLFQPDTAHRALKKKANGKFKKKHPSNLSLKPPFSKYMKLGGSLKKQTQKQKNTEMVLQQWLNQQKDSGFQKFCITPRR